MFSIDLSPAQALAVIMTHGFEVRADLFDLVNEALTVGVRTQSPEGDG
jgi:hypothetical protein